MIPSKLWSDPPPRPEDKNVWAQRLVAWLDRQDRRREVLVPVVEVTINDPLVLNTNLAIQHSLEQVSFGNVPNVNWLIAGVRHSGLGSGAGSTYGVYYADGVVGSNTIELRFLAAGFTINVGNPIRFKLHFWPLVEDLSL